MRIGTTGTNKPRSTEAHCRGSWHGLASEAEIARQPWHENAGKTAMVYRLDMIASQNYSSQSIAWNPNNSAMERMKLALFCIGLSSCS